MGRRPVDHAVHSPGNIMRMKISSRRCSGNQFTIPGLECSGNQRAGHRKLSTLQDISARFQDPHSQITSVPDPSPVRHPAVFQSARTLQDFPASLLEFTCLLHLAATCSSGTSYRFCSAAVVPGSADPLPLQQQSSQSYRLCSSPPRFCSRPLTATAVLPLQEQSSHCRSSPPTAAAVLPVLQVLQQPSQVLQQASRCNSSPPTAATVLSVLQALQQPSQVVQQDSHCNSSPLTAATVPPLQQQCSQSYRFCSPPRFCSRPPTVTVVLPLQQQSSHCSNSPPTAAAVLPVPVLQVLQQPSQVLQQASHCNSSPPTATAVLPLQQQSFQSYRFCSNPPRFSSSPPSSQAPDRR